MINENSLSVILEKNEACRYCEPRSYELSGQYVQLAADNGENFLFHFVNGEVLEWGKMGLAMKWEAYECQKLDRNLYLISLTDSGAASAVEMTLVLDMKEELFTVVFTEVHDDEMQSKFLFGAVKTEGKSLICHRHTYSEDLANTQILWRYSPTDIQNQCFRSDDRMFVLEEGAPEYSAKVLCLKEDFYLISYQKARTDDAGQMFQYLMIADLNRVHGVGCCLYNGGECGIVRKRFAAYGDFQRVTE